MSSFIKTTEEVTYGFVTLNADGSDFSYSGTFETIERAKEVMADYAEAKWHKEAGRTFRLVENRTTRTTRFISE